MSKICIIGANGQLGTALKHRYPDTIAVDRDELDITDSKSVSEFDWSNTDVIINAAAYTNVDGAETDDGRRAAWSINAHGASNLVRVAKQHNITLIHISTEYVFDGSQDNHTENEVFTPLSVYGSSKAAGDVCVESLESYYLLRVTWLIGEGANFVRTMMSLADKDISPTVVSDQVGRLTFTTELVKAIDHLMSTQAPFGTYNMTNGGEPASWADITRIIFSLMGRDDLTVSDTTTEEYFADKPGIAPRPLLSTLDLSKLKATGFESQDWKENLKHYIEGEQQ